MNKIKKGLGRGLSSLIGESKVESQTNKLTRFLERKSVDLKVVNPILEKNRSSPLKQKVKYKSIISRPQIKIDSLIKIKEVSEYICSEKISKEAIEQTEINIKYGGYLNKQKESAKKISRLEHIKIPNDFS